MDRLDDQDLDVRTSDRDGDEATAQPRHEPDVVLDVEKLTVDEISLEVDQLQARVSLHLDVLNLVNLHAGVDAALGRLALTIKGVEAQLLLKVHLDNVTAIVDRVLTTLDRNPQIVDRLLEHVGDATQQLGAGAGQAVGEVGSGAGQAVSDVGQSAGDAVGEVGGQAGQTVGQVGDQAGQTVGDVGDQAGQTVSDVGDRSHDEGRPARRRTRPRHEDEDEEPAGEEPGHRPKRHRRHEREEHPRRRPRD